MEKWKVEPLADPRRVVREQASALWGAVQEALVPVREVAVECWQVVVETTKDYFSPLTGYCPRCEAEKKDHEAGCPMDKDYPDW